MNKLVCSNMRTRRTVSVYVKRYDLFHRFFFTSVFTQFLIAMCALHVMRIHAHNVSVPPTSEWKQQQQQHHRLRQCSVLVFRNGNVLRLYLNIENRLRLRLACWHAQEFSVCTRIHSRIVRTGYRLVLSSYLYLFVYYCYTIHTID